MLNELVLYCESLLDMSSCLKTQKISPTDCANCLKEIHFGNDNGREYDCLNMCCQYVCQNMHRYVTEMVYLFHDTYNQWIKNRQEQLVMCSIGCGPCSELVAWEEYARRQHLDIPYSYDGFDTNSMWSKIQNEVKSLVSPYGNVSFHNEDIFEYYSKREEEKMILIWGCLSRMQDIILIVWHHIFVDPQIIMLSVCDGILEILKRTILSMAKKDMIVGFFLICHLRL